MDPDATDANGYLYRQYPADRAEHFQKVLNASWPMRDDQGQAHARGVNDQPADKHVPVQVRVVLEVDGECWLDGRATRWHGQHVMVVVNDPRIQTGMVWVAAADIRRV